MLHTQSDNREMVNKLLGGAGYAQGVAIPSHWMTKGLQTAGQGFLLTNPQGKAGTLYYLALLWSNGLFAYVVTAWAARKLYRRGYNRLATGGSLRVRNSVFQAAISGLDRLVSGMVWFLDPQTRLLIVKDFRTFRREPAQWAQILIFCGLLVLYFTNMRRLLVSNVEWMYQNGLSLLNLTTTGLLLCIYTGRFIYPMLSLEGKKFWILGLLPLAARAVVVGQVRLLRGRLAAYRRVAGPAQRRNAGNAVVRGGAARCDRGGPGSGAERPECRSGGVHADVQGNRSVEDRGRLRRHIEPGGRAAVPDRGGRVDGAAVAPTGGVLRPPDGAAPEDLLALIGLVPGMVVGALAAWLPLRAGARALARMEF